MDRLNLAIVGRSYPSEAFHALHLVALAKRDRARRWNEAVSGRREWRGSGEPIVFVTFTTSP